MCYSCGSQSQRLEKDQTLSISLHMVMLDEAGGVPATEALVGQDGSSDDRLDRHGPGAAW